MTKRLADIVGADFNSSVMKINKSLTKMGNYSNQATFPIHSREFCKIGIGPGNTGVRVHLLMETISTERQMKGQVLNKSENKNVCDVLLMYFTESTAKIFV